MITKQLIPQAEREKFRRIYRKQFQIAESKTGGSHNAASRWRQVTIETVAKVKQMRSKAKQMELEGFSALKVTRQMALAELLEISIEVMAERLMTERKD